jgi:hypothetical protein
MADIDERLKGIAGGRNDLDIGADDLDESAHDRNAPPEVRWGAWTGSYSKAKWFIPERLSGSDYSGGFISKANYETFIEDFGETGQWDVPFYALLHGGHGTYGIALYIDRTPDGVWEFLEGLESYPVGDDEKLSELEQQGIDEAWENWGARDWARILEEKFGIDCDDVLAKELEGFAKGTHGDLREHFEQARENANIYWEAQGDTPVMWVDMKRVIETLGDHAGAPCAAPESEDGATESAESEPPTMFEPPPRTKGLTARQIAGFRARGLRQGYDFNPRGGQWLVDYEAFMAADPYAGIRLDADTVILHNLMYDTDIRKRAMLVVRIGSNDAILHAWWRTSGNEYQVITVLLSEPPELVVRFGRWYKSEEQAVRVEADEWLNGPNFQEALGASRDPFHRALFYRWMDDSELTEPVWVKLDPQSPGVMFNETKPGDSIDALQLLLNRPSPSDVIQASLSPSEPPPPEVERAPRYPYSPKRLEAFRRSGLRPGYDFNPAERIPGGLSSGMQPEDFDPIELERGTQVELEHTNDPAIAQEIAMDHLVEDPDYYSRLEQSEAYARNGRYFVYALGKRNQILQSEGPWGPYELPSAKSYARISATQGSHDRIVTEGRKGRMVRRYAAGTGERLYP